MSGARLSWLVVPAAAGVLAVAVLVGHRGHGGRECRALLIPAYVPANAVLELARAVRPRLIVINPASGPGTAGQDAYRRAVKGAQRAGVSVLGYVSTGYGARSPADVEADIDRYAAWYGTDGVFLDEAPATDDALPHYRALAEHARAAGGRLVVLNPGIVPAPGYFDIADVVVTFEGPYLQYVEAQGQAPAWVRALPPDRIAMLVYGATRAQADAVVSGSDHAGYVYATSGALPHPWGTVPADLAEDDAFAPCETGGA
jgi:hypothetical protein